MRFGSILILGSASVLLFGALSACGGKVYEAGDEEAGSAGSGGSEIGGSGGTLLGGSGGGPAGSGGYTAGSGGYPAGSGGGPAGSGGYPAGSGGGTGGYPAGSGGGPGGTGGYAGGSCFNMLPPYTECRDCLDMNCCGEVINCFVDPTGYCPYILDCYENCSTGDPYECASMCDGGNFNYEFNNLFACGEGSCASWCANPTPPPVDCPVQSGLPSCDDCIQANCGVECNTCVNNPQCMELLQCVSYCQDNACQQQCINDFPGGIDDLMKFLGAGGCLDNYCSIACY